MNADLDYFELIREAKRPAGTGLGERLKLALLGDVAPQQLAALLTALFRRHQIAVDVYQGPFDAVELEAYDPNSALYRFGPDVIVIVNAVQTLRARYYGRRAEAAEWFAEERERVTRIWDALARNSPALILQSNFVLPEERFFGNFDHKVPPSFYSLVSALNAALVDEARGRNHVLINDLEAVASWAGRSSWFDDRLWYLAKCLCALEHLPYVAKNILDIILATRGRGIKCVILDLDNTLWGGIVGDDGHLGIKVASHGEGEAFYQFQCYLRELKRRGILLAVCSKNERANALRPFIENPDMVLREEDITVFVANWENKAENIRKIREILNIGLDSMVFLDDNPFERNLVRNLLPEVLVPELPEDPAEYVKHISALNLFETSSFSAEDVQRADLYKQEARRKVAEISCGDFTDFLQSLEMKIELSRFQSHQLSRIAQLIQRSNQFNLMTRRHTEAQCERMMNDESLIPVYVKLRDRFGDHGLISVVVARPDDASEALEITDWLMSCRVLTRGVEEYIMAWLVDQAAARGLKQVRGRYVPTAKNSMVKEFYARFGFQKISESESDAAEWVLETSGFTPAHVFITPEEERSTVAVND